MQQQLNTSGKYIVSRTNRRCSPDYSSQRVYRVLNIVEGLQVIDIAIGLTLGLI